MLASGPRRIHSPAVAAFGSSLPGAGLRLEAQRMNHQNMSVIKAKQKSPFAIRLKSFGGHWHQVRASVNPYRICF